jgi:hypothetical protein
MKINVTQPLTSYRGANSIKSTPKHGTRLSVSTPWPDQRSSIITLLLDRYSKYIFDMENTGLVNIGAKSYFQFDLLKDDKKLKDEITGYLRSSGLVA